MANAQVDVVPLSPSEKGDLELQDIEHGKPGKRLREAAVNQNVNAGPGCFNCVRKDFEGLSDFYAHWPREYTAAGKGLMHGWNLMIERLVFGIATLAIFFWSIAYNDSTGNIPWWMLYLTHWILLLTVVHWPLWCAATYLALKVPESERGNATETTPWLARIAMWTHSTGLSVNCIVTLLYWFLLFPDEDEFKPLSVFTHGITFVLMLLDAALAGQRLFLVHLPFPFAFGVSWVLFSLIYWAAGGVSADGEPIYSVVDWEGEPGSAAVLCVLVAFVVLPLTVCACAGLSRLWSNQCRCSS